MKVKVISLLKSNNRNDIEKILKDANVGYDFFNAVNGNELSIEDVNIHKDWKDPWLGNHITRGEVGCALSHINLWKKLIYDCENGFNDDKCMMILEDDFLIRDVSAFKQVVNIKDPNFDFLYLGRKKISSEKETESDLIKTYTNHKTVCSKFSYWTLGYIISYMGAKKLYSEWYENNIFTIDEYIPWRYGQQRIKHFADNLNDNSKFLALEPPVISPKVETFDNSSTYHSKVFNKFRKDVSLISLVENVNSDSVNRYIKSCNSYGFDPTIVEVSASYEINMNTVLKNQLMNIKDNNIVIFSNLSNLMIANQNVVDLIDTYIDKYENKIVTNEVKTDKNGNSIMDRFIGRRNIIMDLVEGKETKIFLDEKNTFFYKIDINDDYKVIENKSVLTYENLSPVFVYTDNPKYNDSLRPIKKSEREKIELNNICNYCCNGWNSTYKYKNNDTKVYSDEELPFILLVNNESHNIKESKELIHKINYPANKLLNMTINGHINNLSQIIKKIEETTAKSIDYIFYVDSCILLKNPNCLRELLKQNKNIISPLLKDQTNTYYTNYWGDFDDNFWYRRSKDYFDIVNFKKKALWNVPYIFGCFLMKSSLWNDRFVIDNRLHNSDFITFCYNLRKNNIFIWLDNTNEYGNIIEDMSKYEKLKKEVVYEKYISKQFLNNYKLENLGDDILIARNMFTEEFCKMVIDKCESSNAWSNGGMAHYDKRIGGKENHPTQDIHLKDIGLENMWKHILHKHIAKLVWDKYRYATKGMNIAFVVKYSMEGQKELRPHHDSSAYTVNVCLNNAFEGGGCRFIHKDRTIVNKEIGSMVVHPGRVTHYHEGLPINSGVRYILVCFIN